MPRPSPHSLVALLAVCGSAAAPAARGDGRYALVVGVEKYDPAELAPLDFAEDDVQALGRALEKLGFSVVTMTSAAESAARRPVLPGDILAQLDRRLADREPTDTVVLAFSGHGVQLTGERANAAGVKELWFCPERARPGDPRTMLAMSEVIRRLSRCGAGRKLLLVDACRNDFEPKSSAKGSRTIELPAAGVKRPPIPAGMVAMFSCRPGEQSFEVDALGHSIFSHHVIEFLEGRAPPDRYPRGEVGITELTSYVRTKTRDTADVRLDRDQVPDVVLPDGSFGEWPLGRLGTADIDTLALEPLMCRADPEAVEAWLAAQERDRPGSLAPLALRVKYHLQDLGGRLDDDREAKQRVVNLAEAAFRRNPDDPWANFAMALIHGERKETDQALQRIDVAIRGLPGRPDAEIEKAWMLTEDAGKDEDGMRLARDLVARYPEDPRVHNALGAKLFNAERFAEGLVFVRRARDLMPEHAVYWNNEAYGLKHLKRFDEALAAYDHAIAAAPLNVQFVRGRVHTLVEAGRTQEALVEFDRAIRRAPRDPEMYRGKAELLWNEKRSQEAIDVLAEGIGRCPDAWRLYLTRAAVRAMLGELVPALDDATRVVDGGEGATLAAAYEIRIKIYRQLGREADAREDEAALERVNKALTP